MLIWVYVASGSTHRLSDMRGAIAMARRSKNAAIATVARSGRYPTRLTWTVDHYENGHWVGRTQGHMPPAWLMPASVLETEARLRHG